MPMNIYSIAMNKRARREEKTKYFFKFSRGQPKAQKTVTAVLIFIVKKQARLFCYLKITSYSVTETQKSQFFYQSGLI